jgi:hypothetical protein
MRPPVTLDRPRRLNRLLRHAWEVCAPCLLLVSLLALVAQVPKWTA